MIRSEELKHPNHNINRQLNNSIECFKGSPHVRKSCLIVISSQITLKAAKEQSHLIVERFLTFDQSQSLTSFKTVREKKNVG